MQRLDQALDVVGTRSHDEHQPSSASRPAVWLSGQQAAEHVGVSWPTLRQTIIDHGIPHVRLGRRWKIEASVLDDHLRRLAGSHAYGGGPGVTPLRLRPARE